MRTTATRRVGSRGDRTGRGRPWTWWFGGALLLAAALVVAVPFLTVWHDRIERQVERLLGSPVEIAALAVGWTPTGLHVTASGVRIDTDAPTRRRDGSEVAAVRVARPVELGSLTARIDPLRSLWRGRLVLGELELREVAVAVERRTDGRLHLAGFGSEMTDRNPGRDLDAAGGEPAVTFDDILVRLAAGRVSRHVAIDRLSLLDAGITLVDRVDGTRRRLPPLDLILARERDRRVAIDLSLPAPVGDALSLSLALDGERQAEFELVLEAVDLVALRELLGPFFGIADAQVPDVGPASAPGTIRLDASLRGTLHANALTRLAGDVSIGTTARGDVTHRISGTSADGAFGMAVGLAADERAGEGTVSLSGDFAFNTDATGWRVASDALVLSSATRRSTLESVSIRRRLGDGDDARVRARGSGERLALADVQLLGRRLLRLVETSERTLLPLPEALSMLERVELDGELLDWQATIDAGDTMLRDVRVDMRTRFEALAMRSNEGHFGFDGLDGALDIERNRGDVTLRGRGLALSPDTRRAAVLPDVFLADLDVDLREFGAWRAGGDVVFDERSVASRTRVSLEQIDGRAFRYAVDAEFGVRDAPALIGKLPSGLAPQVRRWLAGALRAGALENGRLSTAGVIGDQAPLVPEWRFDMRADVATAELRFLPAWPTVRIDRGRIEFDGRTLAVRVDRGEFESLVVERVDLRLPDLASGRLEVEATTSGPLARMIDFANEGPLAAWLQPVLGDVAATGSATVEVDIDASLTREPLADGRLPDHWPMPRYSGAVYLDGNTVLFESSDVELTATRGAVAFDAGGIRMHRVKARYLDQPVLLDATSTGTEGDARTRVQMTGALDAHGVMQRRGIGLDAFVDGVSTWKVSLAIPHAAARRQSDGIGLELASDLIGTRLRLPSPLGKSYGDSAPVVLSTRLPVAGGDTVWRFDGGAAARGYVSIVDGSFDGLRLALGGGEVPAASAEGIAIAGDVPELLLDDWIDGIARLLESLPESDEPERLPPIAMDLDTPEFRVGTQSLGAAALRADSDDDTLGVRFHNASLRGTFDYPRDAGRGAHPLETRIALVAQPFIDGLRSMSGETGPALDPRLLPPIDARVARLQFHELDLEDFVMRTVPDRTGLRIDTLGFAYRDTQLTGEGRWQLDALSNRGLDDQLATHRTQLSLSMQSDDFGNALDRLGFEDVLNEGVGVVTAKVGWDDALYRFDLAKLQGAIEADIRQGRVLGINPGAARIVGLFAYQTLPRRLNLDFKDVVLEGLDFERIVADVDLENGVADARLIQLEGPVGVIDIVGESDLQTGEHDQRLTVLPRVSAALPVIGIISGGAGAGIGALLADGLLKAIGLDVDRLGLREYHLHGTWESPELSPAS